jgi:glutathione synthase/RimK-type ligase-like ATP-grasp enzyme
VVKTLSTPAVLESGGITLAHTHRLVEADLADLSGVGATAHLFQQWAGPKAFEVRVTVVGKRLFPVAIEAGTEAAREDWRNDIDGLTYWIVDVPPPVEVAVSAYMKAFGLHYAAFDFVVTTDGQWVFLEANPGGQYGWLQAATGLPISTAVADLLEKGSL